MIVLNLDVMMAKRKMTLNQLAAEVGMNQSNMSLLKTGKIKYIKLQTLNKLCYILDCTPCDILEHVRVHGEEWRKSPDDED